MRATPRPRDRGGCAVQGAGDTARRRNAAERTAATAAGQRWRHVQPSRRRVVPPRPPQAVAGVARRGGRGGGGGSLPARLKQLILRGAVDPHRCPVPALPSTATARYSPAARTPTLPNIPDRKSVV